MPFCKVLAGRLISFTLPAKGGGDKGGSWGSRCSQKTDRHTTIRVKYQKRGGESQCGAEAAFDSEALGLRSVASVRGRQKYLMTCGKNIQLQHVSGHPITHVRLG